VSEQFLNGTSAQEKAILVPSHGDEFYLQLFVRWLTGSTKLLRKKLKNCLVGDATKQTKHDGDV